MRRGTMYSVLFFLRAFRCYLNRGARGRAFPSGSFPTRHEGLAHRAEQGIARHFIFAALNERIKGFVIISVAIFHAASPRNPNALGFGVHHRKQGVVHRVDALPGGKAFVA